jgi:hypothetical protein
MGWRKKIGAASFDKSEAVGLRRSSGVGAVDTPMLTHPCDLDTTLQVAAQLKIASEWLGGDRLKTHAEGYFSRHPAARAL